MTQTVRLGLVALTAFIATILLSNWLVTHFGVVDVGFGQSGPAAVYAVGLAFTLRDFAHRALGPWPIIVAILIGAGLSVLISPTFALASGVAFLISETADLVVYTPLSERTWLGGVILSNTVGLVVDSFVFLWLAFGSLDFFWGQVVGKAWMTAVAVVLILAVRGIRAFLPARYA